MLATAIAATALTLACGEKSNRKEIRGPKPAGVQAAGGGAPAPAAAKKVDPATAGTISGTIKWEGAQPTKEKIDISGNAECVRVQKDTIYDEKLVVNPNNTVRFAFVTIDCSDVYEPPAEPITMDQVGCHYIPHVFALVSGQKLNIKSSDPLLHNVHYIPTNDANEEKNIAMPAPTTKNAVFVGPDKVKFKCEVHPWMGAWCYVQTHPFFAISGEDGTYTIKNVPPGTYKLVLKHESLGEQTASVTVETGKTATADFTLKR
jgi:hypothetical protein